MGQQSALQPPEAPADDHAHSICDSANQTSEPCEGHGNTINYQLSLFL